MTREPTRQVLALKQGRCFPARQHRLAGACRAAWNTGGSDLDVYTLGVGGRYYFDKIGVYLGADVNVDRWDWGHDLDDTKFSFGLEAGYASFLTRTVTIEPAAYWNVNSDRSKFGLKVGFGFYF